MLKAYRKNYDSALSFLWLFAGIGFFLFSNGRWIVPVCAWLAPVFLLKFISHKKAFFGLFILFLLILFATRVIYHEIIPSLLGLLAYILFLYYTILAFLPYLAHRMLVHKIDGFIGTLVFPSVAVVVEYLNTVMFGSWASVAYSQFGDLPLIQLSSVTGIWGITFIVMWFGPVLNWIGDRKFEWAKVRKEILIFVTIFVGVLLYGGLRLGMFRPGSKTVRVASLTATQEINALGEAIQEKGFVSSVSMAAQQRDSLNDILGPVHEAIFVRTGEVARSGASLVFWPEGMVVVLEENQDQFIARGRDLARSEQAYLLMAYFVIPRKNPKEFGENKSVLINPKGDIEWEYLKTHPVPGSTDKPGDGNIPVSQTPFGRVASVICYDMDFTNLIRKAGKLKTDIMIVPAWDWKAIDPLHTYMAVFRAVENGFSMIRQTGEGLSIAVDYQGRVLAEMDHFTSENHVMFSDVPVKGIITIYSRIGDLFAWLCIAVVFIFFLWNLIRRLGR